MKTAAEMVHFFGSNKFVAMRLRVTQRTVANWVTQNYIGRESCLDFYNLLVEFGYQNANMVDIISLTKIKKEAAK